MGFAQEVPADARFDELKQLSLEELTQVQVTSVSRRPEKLSETASAVQVISSEEIRRSAATTLPEALRLASNLDVGAKSAHDWAISARGFNTDLSNKLLVLMDGRTLYTPLFSGVRWDVQNYILEDIERIEVISGPGGTLWGANAVNGVINIISKPASETLGSYAEAAAGTQLRGNYAFRYGGQASSKVFYRVYGQSIDTGEEQLPDGSRANDGSAINQAGFRIDADVTSAASLTVQGDIYHGKEGYVAGGESTVDGANVLSRWQQKMPNGSQMALQVYYDRTELEQPALSIFAAPGLVHDVLETFDVDFQHQLPIWKAMQLVWGTGYRATNDDFKAAPALAFNPPKLRQELFSGFGQAAFRLPFETTLTLGSKVEHNDYTGWEVEPTIRFQWAVNRDSLLWTAVSRAVRTPSRIDRDLAQPSPPLVILSGGSDFDSESVVAYELGYRIALTPTLVASVATFYNHYDNLRSVRTTPVTLIPFVFANDLRADTHGLELTSTWQALPWWRLTGGYSYLEENVTVEDGKFDLNNGLNETADPRHQFSLRSSMDLGRKIEADAQLRWVDRLPINNGGRLASVPSYAELDLRLGWKVTPRIDISVVGQNLLNKNHPEYGPPGAHRVELTRSVYIKAAWRY
ncbi:MAG TPA: TonB-dependent receptor [Opitutaceae bacterium]|nr:TonB-dependent receptor [Opitutaceae bacterium]